MSKNYKDSVPFDTFQVSSNSTDRRVVPVVSPTTGTPVNIDSHNLPHSVEECDILCSLVSSTCGRVSEFEIGQSVVNRVKLRVDTFAGQ